MAKVCSSENCSNPVFSHEFCRNHQYLRTDSKKPKAISKMSSKKREYVLNAAKELKKLDQQFYLSIWEERPHYCSNPDCKKFLGHEPRTYFFDHLAEKAKYPELRHEKNNIVLLCGDCHSMKTGGKILPYMAELINNVLEKFKI